MLSRLLLAATLLGLAVPVASASVRSRYRAFRSPTGAIQCAMLSVTGGLHEASCTSAYTLRRLRPGCGAGSAVVINLRGRAYLDSVCNPFGFHLKPLRYGHSISLGGLRCSSARTGMTCRSLQSGHGFKLSRNSLKRF